MLKRPIIAITIGDPNGIGPEIIVKALSQKEIRNAGKIVIIGPGSLIENEIKKLDLSLDLARISKIEQIRVSQENICVYNKGFETWQRNAPGEVSISGGKLAGKSLEMALKAALNRNVDAIVTAPISKKAFNLAGYPYPGQTEFFAEKTKVEDALMILLYNRFRVGLVTTHCAISAVSSLLRSETILNKLNLLHRDLQKRFKIPEPVIGVTALNPHAGEAGLFGSEELNIIMPALESAKKSGINVEGPFPADSLFARTHEQFDAYLAMYHDQGLIPLKMKSFGKAVNYTAGLPIIRTSPDHGTAYDIAGQGLADPSSMKEAIKLAVKLAKNI